MNNCLLQPDLFLLILKIFMMLVQCLENGETVWKIENLDSWAFLSFSNESVLLIMAQMHGAPSSNRATQEKTKRLAIGPK